MHILHLTTTLASEAGGVPRSVMDTSKALAAEGLEVTILSHNLGTIDLPWTGAPPPNLSLHLCAAPWSVRFVSRDMKRTLPDAIAHCDILHVHGLWQRLNALATRTARRLGKPYVCSIRGMLDPWSTSQRPWRKKIYYRLVDRKVLAHAAALHFTAADELKKARPWVPEGVRTEVVPNVINLALFLDLPPRTAAYPLFPQIPSAGEKSSDGRGAPWILFLSRIHEKKGLHLLIQAFATLPATFRHAQLVIAGSGEAAYIESLKAHAQRCSAAPRVHFVGLVQGAAKAALYRTAELLAVPTSQENFGLVFPEALACETPVLLTAGVDIHREILAADAGYLVTQDVPAIRAALTAALTDRAANRRRGAAGRQWVLQTLQPAAIAQRWRTIYQSLLP